MIKEPYKHRLTFTLNDTGEDVTFPRIWNRKALMITLPPDITSRFTYTFPYPIRKRLLDRALKRVVHFIMRSIPHAIVVNFPNSRDRLQVESSISYISVSRLKRFTGVLTFFIFGKGGRRRLLDRRTKLFHVHCARIKTSLTN